MSDFASILCAGCRKRPIGKNALSGTTLCRRCAAPNAKSGCGAGRKRKGVELRVSQSSSVDPATKIAWKDADVPSGEFLIAIIAGTNGKPTAETLERIKALFRAA